MKGHLIALTTVLILAVLATSVAQTQKNAIAQPGQPGQSGGGRTAGGGSGEASGTFGNGCGWCAAGRYYWALNHIEDLLHHLPK